MKTLKDVHTEHCCAIHGCKYGDEECTVVLAAKNKKYVQSFPCEDCVSDGINSVEDVIRFFHPTAGTFANHIILYAKNWYGSSYNGEEKQAPSILNDIRKLQARFFMLEEKYVTDKDVQGVILDTFLEFARLHDQKEGLREAFGWYWGRDRNIVSDREPVVVMIAKLGIVKGKFAYLPELYEDICYDRDKGLDCATCDRARIPDTEWNSCKLSIARQKKFHKNC